MTPKEKAQELEYNFIHNETSQYVSNIFANTLANIVVDELIDCLPSVNGQPPNNQKISKHTKEYWQEVKKELEFEIPDWLKED